MKWVKLERDERNDDFLLSVILRLRDSNGPERPEVEVLASGALCVLKPDEDPELAELCSALAACAHRLLRKDLERRGYHPEEQQP